MKAAVDSYGEARLGMSKSERDQRRRLLRPLLVLAALAAFAVVFVPSGSADPLSVPGGYQVCLVAGDGSGGCTATAAGGDYSVITGANPELSVTITNDDPSETLDSADITVPTGIDVSIDTLHSPQPASYTLYAGNSNSTDLNLSGLGIAPGDSKTVSFFVNSSATACTDGTWATTATSATEDSYTNPPDASGGLTSLVAASCQLAFQTVPTAAQPNKVITGSPYSESGTSVTVATPTLPVPLSGGSVNLDIKTGSFDQGASSFTGTGPSAFSSGTAMFGSLKANGTGGPFTLKASAAGFSDAVSSPAFAITKNGEACVSTCATLPGTDPSGNPLTQISTSAGFSFIGTSPSSVPSTVPTGCANWKSLGVSGFVEFDGRTDPVHASMTVTYFVSQKALQAKYGKNVGQQFIPICVGVKYVDSSGQPLDCNTDPSPKPTPYPWKGDQLDGSGKFTGQHPSAVCSTTDGYWWGIVSSFQDKLKGTNPVVTSWSTVTIGGVPYRAFVMSVPAGVDYKGGG
jgi:hypothetical protein